MRPFLVTPPAAPLVQIEDLRADAREDTSDRDGLLLAYEQAAVALFDGYSGRLGRCLLRQKWAVSLALGCSVWNTIFPDCREFAVERLTGETWDAVAGVTIEVACDAVFLSDLPDDLAGVHLTFWAGWDDAAAVPPNLSLAVRHMVKHWLQPPENVAGQVGPNGLPVMVNALISSYQNVVA